MLHIALCILFGYIVFIIINKSRFKSKELFAKVACSCIAVYLFYMASHVAIMKIYSNKEAEVCRKELIAFGDKSSVSGSFYLGCGSIGGKFYYTYYYKVENNGTKFGKILVDNATVYEENISNGYISTNAKSTMLGNWFFIDWPIRKTTCIYIPEGSIKREFKLDMT